VPDVNPIPDTYTRLTPYLSVTDAAAAIAFYCDVLGATERMRMTGPDEVVGHAEVTFGDAVLMLADESPDFGNISPPTLGGSPVGLTLYVVDVDAIHAAAVAAGADERQPPTDQFYGDRSSTIVDPFGHVWHLMTHIEDVSEEEMQRRMDAMMSSND
jgi:PhnB protein